MAALRYLAVAINRRRLGYVFLVGHQLKDWQTMTKPTKSPNEAARRMKQLIEDFQPDVVVTEDLDRGEASLCRVAALKRALSGRAADAPVLDVSVKRAQQYADKYEEAALLATAYPELKPWVPPKRRFFDDEPARMVLFVAAALAYTVQRQPSLQLAAAMR